MNSIRPDTPTFKMHVHDWVSFVKAFRGKTELLKEYFKNIQETSPDLTEDEVSSLKSISAFAQVEAPIVQYLVPNKLREQLGDGVIPIDIPFKELFNLPFSPMALADDHRPSRWMVFAFIPGDILLCAFADAVHVIPIDCTLRQMTMEYGAGSRLSKTVALLMYLSGGDSTHRVVSRPGGKRDRNNPRPTVIRGEVGGKFVSALRRYEAQQEAAPRPHGSPRPHLRAGHFALYWTGKGSRTGTGPRVPKIQFIHPCLVNADSVGPDVEIRRVVK